MARTVVTKEMIVKINELYAEYGVKAQVARELGISASTVSKYIAPNYVPEAQRPHEDFDLEEYHRRIAGFVLPKRRLNERLLEYEEGELEEVRRLQKELSI